MPLPKKLLEQGVRDMVRICDGRMSGTAYGTVVLHVTPEAAAGGPLAIVATGDSSSSTCRRAASTSSVPARGAGRSRAHTGDRRRRTPGRRAAGSGSTSSTCMQADTGADLDFLTGPAATRSLVTRTSERQVPR